MATLNDQQIIDAIEKRPFRHLIDHGEAQHKRARLHLYGIGMKEHLTLIEGFEKPFMHALKLKYAQSNKDLFTRVGKAITKIFTARGGSIYFNLGPEGNALAAALDANIRSGLSTKKWLENFWKPHMLDDPMGVLYMEINDREVSYPTYKCITSIHDYQPDDGLGFEYIIFKVDKDEKKRYGLQEEHSVYRVVDDYEDKLVILHAGDKVGEGKSRLEKVQQFSYLNHFYDVPAMFCGFVFNPTGEGLISIYDCAWDLADHYLLKAAIKLTSDFNHAFPKYWEFGDDCIKCKGTGKGKGQQLCPDCFGSGKKLLLRPSDNKILKYPSKDAPNPAPHVGGYIEPSEIFHKIATETLAQLEEKIWLTIWGSKPTSKLKPGMGLSAAENGTVTATEVMDNRQPEVECLNPIADAVEQRHKFILDYKIQYDLNKGSYRRSGGCSVNYGRRYLIEEPDALLTRYYDAMEKGVSPGILYGMYEQYLEAKYQSDHVSLLLHKKLMKVEPMMHYTLEKVQSMGDPELTRAKMWYGEWLVQQDGDTLIMQPVKVLQDSLNKFLSLKPLPKSEQDRALELETAKASIKAKQTPKSATKTKISK